MKKGSKHNPTDGLPPSPPRPLAGPPPPPSTAAHAHLPPPLVPPPPPTGPTPATRLPPTPSPGPGPGPPSMHSPPASPASPRSRSPQGREVASIGERVASRAIDLAVMLPVLLLIAGGGAALRATTGIEEIEGQSDWISSLQGFLTIVIVVLYDPVVARWFNGTTPGKKATKRRVIRWEDGSPAPALVLLGRNALLFCEWITFIPGVIDVMSAANRPDGRTWVDRATGTAVINEREATSNSQLRAADPAALGAAYRPEPWGGLIAAAAGSCARLGRTIGSIP